MRLACAVATNATRGYSIPSRAVHLLIGQQTEQQRIQEEANRKRSEKAKAQPRTEDGTKLTAEEQVVQQSVGTPAKDKNVAQSAKAAASKTNPGAVARGDKLAKERPDLAPGCPRTPVVLRSVLWPE